jgi:acetolactate synthase-1/2/3 large subunit
VTALADARLDSVPLVAITGQVATSLIGSGAFQEVDTTGMTLPVTKKSVLVRSAAELLAAIPDAFATAASGRPGPVVIDGPRDVQMERVDIRQWPEPWRRPDPPDADHADIERAAAMIREARRPVIYAGGGIARSGCSRLLHQLAGKCSIPTALTLMGLGSFPPGDPLYLGMIGMHGSPAANIILDEADLVLALGARFDDRAVGLAHEFCKDARVIHVDIDEAQIHKVRKADCAIVGDASRVLEGLVPLLDPTSRPEWLSRVGELKALFRPACVAPDGYLHPLDVVGTVHRLAPPGTIVCTDVGQHQMWVAQAYPFDEPGTFLTSGGLGTMGFGLPAAIGAALANPGRRVLCISGDGSLQMNIQELATLAELCLPVTILVMNNGHLGLVRQQQELFYEGNYIASRFEIDLDFAALGRQYGLSGYRPEGADELAATLREALARPGPALVDIPVYHGENALPMVRPGGRNTEMIGMSGSCRGAAVLCPRPVVY